MEVKPLLALNNLHVTTSYVTPAVWMQTENRRETSDFLFMPIYFATCVKHFEIPTLNFDSSYLWLN